MNKILKTTLAHIILVVIFSIIYFLIGKDNFNNIEDNYIDYLYFSFITSSSIGYGDITPKTNLAKILVMLHASTTFINVVNIISIF